MGCRHGVNRKWDFCWYCYDALPATPTDLQVGVATADTYNQYAQSSYTLGDAKEVVTKLSSEDQVSLYHWMHDNLGIRRWK
jgi:hypothetical protein